VFVSHPFASSKSQFPKPPEHRSPHTPAAHSVVAPARTGHAIAHAPQLRASTRRSDSHPFAGLASQSPKFASHRNEQRPPVHTAVPLTPVGHTVEHAPQFAGSSDRSRQAPSQSPPSTHGASTEPSNVSGVAMSMLVTSASTGTSASGGTEASASRGSTSSGIEQKPSPPHVAPVQSLPARHRRRHVWSGAQPAVAPQSESLKHDCAVPAGRHTRRLGSGDAVQRAVPGQSRSDRHWGLQTLAAQTRGSTHSSLNVHCRPELLRARQPVETASASSANTVTHGTRRQSAARGPAIHGVWQRMIGAG